jgi:hypothetical protein
MSEMRIKQSTLSQTSFTKVLLNLAYRGQLIRVVYFFVVFDILVFYPAFLNTLPWSDDWGYIYYVNDSSRNIAQDAIAAGRPLLALLDQMAYQSSFILDNLMVLQLISLLAILILQVAIFKSLKQKQFSNSVSILVPLVLILIPGIQGYVYFLSCFPYTLACLLGFISYSLVNSSQTNRVISGCTLFVFAFLIYPPGAMFYFLGHYIELLLKFRNGVSFRSNLNHLLHAILRLVFCSALSVVSVIPFRLFFQVDQSSRIEFLNSLEDFQEKFAWVFSRIFVSEFRIFTVASPSAGQAAIETMFVFAFFVLFVLKPIKELTLTRVFNFGLLLLVPILGALPNLIILENQFEFRTLTSTFAMSSILFVLAINEMFTMLFRSGKLSTKLASKQSEKTVFLACLPFVFVVAYSAQQDSRDLWIEPSLIRDKITHAALQELNFEDNDPICMVIPEQIYSPLKKLGIYSMQTDLVSSWVPEPYIKYQLEHFSLDPERKITVSRIEEECDSSDAIIDYSGLVGNR